MKFELLISEHAGTGLGFKSSFSKPTKEKKGFAHK